jgi:hypothetical protein
MSRWRRVRRCVIGCHAFWLEQLCHDAAVKKWGTAETGSECHIGPKKAPELRASGLYLVLLRQKVMPGC